MSDSPVFISAHSLLIISDKTVQLDKGRISSLGFRSDYLHRIVKDSMSLKNPILDVTDFSITDFSVDAIRRRVSEVCVETTEFLAGIEHAFGEFGDARRGIAFVS